MVAQMTVDASNARILTELPPGLTAVFIGATSGLGEMTLMAFAKHAKAPNVLFVGRNVDAGNRIQQACVAENPEGSFTFIARDTSLLCNVDELCEEITAQTQHVYLLVLSTGILDFSASKCLRVPGRRVHRTRLRFFPFANLQKRKKASTNVWLSFIIRGCALYKIYSLQSKPPLDSSASTPLLLEARRDPLS